MREYNPFSDNVRVLCEDDEPISVTELKPLGLYLIPAPHLRFSLCYTNSLKPLTAFLEYKKAFDLVDHNLLIAKLYRP